MEIILAAIIGATIYRARGMGLFDLPRPSWQILFALGYASVSYQPQMVGVLVGIIAAVSVLLLTTGAVATGHASLIDLGTSTRLPADGQREEWYSGWIPWPGSYVHDFLGLMVSGVLISAPCGLVVAFSGHVGQGAAIVASGALKAPAYAIGRFAPLNDKLKVSEPLCGAFLWGSLVWIAAG